MRKSLQAPRALFALVAAFASVSSGSATGFEPEPFLRAPALVQAALLSGPDFRVVPEVQVRGYMADFLITTKFGPIHADSVQMLAIRVSEIPALDALDRASKTSAFSAALAHSGDKAGKALFLVATHPVDTLTGLPIGVARYFSRQWQTWSHRAESLSDRATKQFENVGDPYVAATGPMTAGRRAAPVTDEPATTKTRAWYARIGREAEREIKRQVKYDKQRREMAKVLGIDPDTSNPLLNDKLDSLAWAAAWGGFSGAQALGQIGGVVAGVLSDTGKLNDYVWTKTPTQLREINSNRLLAFCSDEYAVRQFMRRGGFTDSLRTSLTDTLEKLEPQNGCDALVELATTTRSEVEARFIVNALRLIQRQSDVVGGSLRVIDAAIAWQTRSGDLLLPLPVDYLSWNQQLANFFDQPELRISNKTVLIGGHASMLTQRQLTQRGWSLALLAPYDGEPAYVKSIVFKHQ